MGLSTRKERDKMSIRLALEYLTDGDLEYRFGELSRQDIIDGLNHALGGPAPPWWAEVLYEHRAERREYREEAVDADLPTSSKVGVDIEVNSNPSVLIEHLQAENARALAAAQQVALFDYPRLATAVRRMLIALDRYWAVSQQGSEWEPLWWSAFERWRSRVEEALVCR